MNRKVKCFKKTVFMSQQYAECKSYKQEMLEMLTFSLETGPQSLC